MNIVYVSPESKKTAIVQQLEGLDHSVTISDPSMEGIETAPDLIVVDLTGGEASPAVVYWREQGVPLLGALTAGVSLTLLQKMDEVIFADASREELALRIDVARMRTGQVPSDLIKANGLTINSANYEVTIDGESVDLTYKEFELLKYLASNRGRVITRDILLDRVWGYDYFGGTRTVDVHVRRLRAKLGRYESLIETVRNVGYRFKR
ncbi:MAG: winged helix-turn-helix transcriptional regulator [Candidatus Aquicultorales bacterium]